MELHNETILLLMKLFVIMVLCEANFLKTIGWMNISDLGTDYLIYEPIITYGRMKIKKFFVMFFW